MTLRNSFVIGAFLFAGILLHGMFFSSPSSLGQQVGRAAAVGRYQFEFKKNDPNRNVDMVYAYDTQTGRIWKRENRAQWNTEWTPHATVINSR